MELHPTLQEWEASFSLPGRLIMEDTELRKRSSGIPENTDDKPVSAFSRYPYLRDNAIAGELAEHFISGRDVIKGMGCTRLRASEINAMHQKYKAELTRVASPAVPVP
jgi:hypothetical protein